jgi:hypothetical protein
MRRPLARKRISRPDGAGTDRAQRNVRVDPNSAGLRCLPHTHTHRGRDAVRRPVCNSGLAGRPEAGETARRRRRALAAAGGRASGFCALPGEGGRAPRRRAPFPRPEPRRRQCFLPPLTPARERGKGAAGPSRAAARQERSEAERGRRPEAAARRRSRFPDVRPEAGPHLATYTRDGPQRRGRSTRRQQRRGRRVAAKCRPASSPVRPGGASAPAGSNVGKCVQNRPSRIVENSPWSTAGYRGNCEEVGRC